MPGGSGGIPTVSVLAAAGSSSAYDVVVVLHVVTVVVGTGGLAISTGYLVAGWASERRHRPVAPAVTRVFGPRPSWAPRLLYPAAALGLAAAGLSHDRVRLQAAWVWVAGVLWFGAAAAIEGGMRPAERRIGARPAPDEGGSDAPPSGFARGAGAALAAVALALAASAVMVVKP